MSVVRLREYAASTPPDSVLLFKEDRPRRIDRVISFFGDRPDQMDDPCGEVVLDLFSREQEAER